MLAAVRGIAGRTPASARMIRRVEWADRGDSAPRRDWLYLILAALLVAAVVVPWTSFESDTRGHWVKVQWLPFVSRPSPASGVLDELRYVAEMVANVALYVPLGAAAYRLCGGWRTLILAAVLSAVTEYTQLYSHTRIPSTTDLVCNLAGAWMGVRLARRQPRASAPKKLAAPTDR
jgi:glycopeptide antibiotics resistance protein